MKTKIEAFEKSQVKITISLDKDEWNAQIASAYNKTKGKYSIPGFRKGKVPMKVLTNTYGEGLFYEEAINLAFHEFYPTVLDSNKDIDAVGSPELDVEKIDENGLDLVCLTPVKPVFELGQYKGMNIEKVEYNVTDEEIDAEINQMREKNARLIDVQRAAQMGDSANINFSGSLNGEKFQGGTAENFDLVLGSNSFIPGFEEGVVGMAIGETKVLELTFPESYQEKTLAGQLTQFEVVLNSLKEKELPETDDEFAKDASEFDSLAALKEDIKSKKEEQNKNKASAEIENKILDKIAENTEIIIPDAMVEAQMDNMVQDFEYRLMYQGLNLETYLGYLKITMEKFREDFRENAGKNVKAQLIIDKIIEVEKISASAEDVEKEIEKIATTGKKSVEEYKQSMKEGQREYIERNVIIDKLFEMLKAENVK